LVALALSLRGSCRAMLNREQICLQLYSFWLLLHAAQFAWTLISLELSSEVAYCWGLVVLLMIHARWNWLGAVSGRVAFFNVAIVGRCLASGLLLVLPLLEPSRVGTGKPVLVPHISRGFGVFEVAWLILQISFWFLRKDENRATQRGSINVNRIIFGLYCGAIGTWMIVDSVSFMEFFGLASKQTLFVSDNRKTGFIFTDFTWSVWPSITGDTMCISPFYLLSCFTRLLGIYNVVAGVWGIVELIEAGKQGGVFFSLFVVALVLCGYSPRLLLLPSVDIISILLNTLTMKREQKINKLKN
jgi:hypothetical protein